jgi:Domain of unknown function (DUF4136)
MRQILQLTMAVVTVFIVTGCATTMTVSSHVERGLDLSRYHTFDWGPADALPTGDARLDKDPFFNDHVLGAVERGLSARGFELASAGSPDLLIHYHASITRRLDVNRQDRVFGYCAPGECPAEMAEYEAGTLVLDIVDTRSNRLLWRGWAQNSVEDMLDDPDRMAKTIEEAVVRMLRRLPPKL